MWVSKARVSLPVNGYGKVAVDFCSDQGGMKEHSISYVTEEQRRYGQKDQDLVCSEFSGNDTKKEHSSSTSLGSAPLTTAHHGAIAKRLKNNEAYEHILHLDHFE